MQHSMLDSFKSAWRPHSWQRLAASWIWGAHQCLACRLWSKGSDRCLWCRRSDETGEEKR